jgi:hypothetical protein
MSGFGYRNLGFGGGSFVPAEFEIAKSMRFEDGDSAYLEITHGSAGNTKLWTWSAWIKRGNLGGHVRVFSAQNSGNNSAFDAISFLSGNTFRLLFEGDVILVSTQVFRDPSAWYHLVLAVDTAQGTAANRVKLYVNGTQVTAFSTADYPDENYDTNFNAARIQRLGAYAISGDAGSFYDGYMAEVHFIDGTALTPSTFGEAGDYGEWKPKEVSGVTYGTNGFYLDFELSATGTGGIGKDQSGNGNDFASSGYAATDQMLDSPTNNFCTMSPIDRTTNHTISEGNLKTAWSAAAGTFGTTKGTIGVNVGKWYWEIRYTYGHAGVFGVFATNDVDTAPDTDLFTSAGSSTFEGLAWRIDTANNIKEVGEGQQTDTGMNFASGDILGIAFDADNGKFYGFKNGAEITGQDIGAGTSLLTAVTVSDFYLPFIFNGDGGSGTKTGDSIINFGTDSSFAGSETGQNNADGGGIGDFYYAPPSGFLALCTKNLSAPAVIPSASFNTVLWTGNGTDGAAGQTVTGVGFQSDWTWLKNRDSGTAGHIMTDSVRGAGNAIFPNNTSAGDSDSTGGHLSAWNSDGFVLFGGSRVNVNTHGHVAWNWLAAGAPSGTALSIVAGLGAGTITVSGNLDNASQSVNQPSGFSITKYTGTDATNSADNLPHNLGAKPNFIVIKSLHNTAAWIAWHSGQSSGKNMRFDTNSAEYAHDVNGFINGGTTGTTNIVLGGGSSGNSSVSGAGAAGYVCYAFHDVAGYSKFGSYKGNANADGPFVHTGFKPAMIIVKEISPNARGWMIYDNIRSPANVINIHLRPEVANAEAGANAFNNLDFVANGFKWRSGTNSEPTNESAIYLYAAWAETPFKYAAAE